MAEVRNSMTYIHLLTVCFISSKLFLAAQSVSVNIINNCNVEIWPAVFSNTAAVPRLPATAFFLRPGDSRALYVPPDWSGKIWGRTQCSRDGATGFSCVTGDCGSSPTTPECTTTAPVTTVAEFALKGGSSPLGLYYVSLVGGFNLPMSAGPGGGGGNCTETGCFADMNEGCPEELRVEYGGGTVACRSGCTESGEAYCSSGDPYSNFFVSSCPLASTSFACASNDYAVTFCPSSSPPESSSSQTSSDQFNGETHTKPDSQNQTKPNDHPNKRKRKNIVSTIVAILVALGFVVGLLSCVVRGICANRKNDATTPLNTSSPSTSTSTCPVTVNIINFS